MKGLGIQSPIRILQALTKSDIGGTERMVLTLVSCLDSSRFSCDVSFLDGLDGFAKQFRAIGVSTHDLSGSGMTGAFWRLVKLMRINRFDIIHLYGFRMSLIGRVAARFVKPRPIVIHGLRGLHVTEGEEVERLRTRLAITLERFGSALIDAYIVNSWGAVEFLSCRGIPRRKFIVIPNGIKMRNRHSKALKSVQGVTKIICVANFRPVKRHSDLIEAIALLKMQGTKVHCLLIGDGPTRNAVEALCREKKLEEIVDFLGSCQPSEVERHLDQAEIFVLPSLWEGMPLSIMEAMAAGLPIVGTDVPGIRELVIDGITGYLTPPKDPTTLADRLKRLIENTELRSKMGEAGRYRIQSEFPLTKMIEQHEQAYIQLLDQRVNKRTKIH